MGQDQAKSHGRQSLFSPAGESELRSHLSHCKGDKAAQPPHPQLWLRVNPCIWAEQKLEDGKWVCGDTVQKPKRLCAEY